MPPAPPSPGLVDPVASPPDPRPPTPARLAEQAACLAGLAGVDALALVVEAGGERRVVACHPAGDVSGVSPDVEEVLRAGGSRRLETAGVVTIVEPVRGSGDATGAIVVRCSGASAVGAEERVGRIAPLVATLLEWASLVDGARAVEAELQRTRTRLRELSRAVSSGIATVGLDGRVQDINSIAAEILGLEPDDVLGRHFSDFVAPDDLSAVAEIFSNRAAGYLSRHESEVHVVRPDGERRLVQVTSSPLLEGMQIAGVYFAARDITDERGREVQLRRAERLASLAPLLGGVCHELNNPLTSIKSFAELLLLDDRPADDVEALEIVRREAGRAARIVSDLKLVARQTQEDGQLAYVQVNDLVRAACDAARPECAAIGATLRLDLADDLPQLCGSRSQLERLVAQLLSNALQALADHTGERQVVLRTYETERGIGLRVQDSGPGIPPEDVERIFDPFWTTRTTGEGTGLGLSLAHSIVADHKGEISVVGGWGSGAAFTVELPRTAAVPGAGIEPPVQAPARLPLHILVVDDEAPIRYAMARYMSRRGHTVQEAEEGATALHLLDSANDRPFDVILADLRMPGLGGDELYARLRARGDGSDERLIFITGDAEGSGAAALIERSGVPVVQKPFELAEIAQIIEAHAAAAA